MPDRPPPVEAIFAALPDPARRAVVKTPSAGPARLTDLARPLAMVLPPFTRHPGVPETAGVIASRREGRSRVCALNHSVLRAAANRRLRRSGLSAIE